ncbi:MAG: hypothetical protein IMZ62_10560 [Chloroflexi bacterium]|nr:hypothetical protein [Chloroflexota bacterium]
MSWWDWVTGIIGPAIGGLIGAGLAGWFLFCLQRRASTNDRDEALARQLYDKRRKAIRILKLKQNNPTEYAYGSLREGGPLERVADIKHNDLIPLALQLSAKHQKLRNAILRIEEQAVTVKMIGDLEEILGLLENSLGYAATWREAENTPGVSEHP